MQHTFIKELNPETDHNRYSSEILPVNTRENINDRQAFLIRVQYVHDKALSMTTPQPLIYAPVG